MAGRAGQGLKPVFLASFAAAFLAASCATVGRGTVREDGAFAALGDGGQLYLRVDVAAARPLLDALGTKVRFGLGTARVAEALDRTDTAALALFPAGGPRRYSVAAIGRYPVARGSFSLAASPEWKKEKASSGERYWRSAKGVSLAFSKGSALISDGEPFVHGASPQPPVEFAAYADAPALSGWIREPSAVIAGFLGESLPQVRLPVEELVFASRREAGADRYTLEARLVAASAERGKALAAILKLVRSSLGDASLPPGGALLKTLLANPPVMEGAVAILRSEAMGAEEIALLCADVSIYFSQ